MIGHLLETSEICGLMDVLSALGVKERALAEHVSSYEVDLRRTSTMTNATGQYDLLSGAEIGERVRIADF